MEYRVHFTSLSSIEIETAYLMDSRIRLTNNSTKGEEI